LISIFELHSIASTLCGASLRSDDPRFARLTDNVNVVFTEGTTPNSPINVFPWLSHLPPFRQQQALVHARMDETVQMMQQVFQGKLQKLSAHFSVIDII
jgi:hypothetical protein